METMAGTTFSMIKYSTPTELAFQSRKIFYTSTKTANETVEEWFHRIQQIVNDCDFGELSDVMLIDKFISGLGGDLLNRFMQASTFTVDEIYSIATANDSDPDNETEMIPRIGEILVIKNEQVSSDCIFSFFLIIS